MSDQYDKILQAMEPGLIITLNNQSGYESPELRVEYASENQTEVGLVGSGHDWLITRDNGSLVFGRCDEFGLVEQNEVVTIEVLGVE